MVMWQRFQKLTTIFIGSSSGVAAYLYLQSHNDEKNKVHNSWTNSEKPVSECAKWDHNWDCREPRSLVKPLKVNHTAEDENIYNAKLESVRPKATRHIFLIRHGEYLDIGDSDADKHLTEVGRKQAKHTGERLKALNIKWDRIIVSTMTRAQETAKIATGVMGLAGPFENCNLIREGAPIAPEPPVGHWKPEASQFYRDGARIEAGYRKYFHRADVEEPKDTYTLIVGHGNVIRYFVCRALQFPPEAWLRMSLNHGSITWISILPSGRTTIRNLGDSGHIPADLITHKLPQIKQPSA